MSARLGPVPGFPRWTGFRVHVTGPAERSENGALIVNVYVRITRRARWYLRARLLLGLGVPGATA